MNRSTIIKGITTAIIITVWAAAAARAEQDAARLELGGGLVISSDYGDLLEAVYPDANFISPVAGWLDLHAGIRIEVADRLTVAPSLDLLMNAVVVSGTGRDESYLNTILVPSVSGRYVFQDGPSAYVAAELNYNLPRTGSDFYEMESGGIGYGLSVGYAFEGGFAIEGGYLNVPVEISGAFTDNIGGGLRFSVSKTL